MYRASIFIEEMANKSLVAVIECVEKCAAFIMTEVVSSKEVLFIVKKKKIKCKLNVNINEVQKYLMYRRSRRH